MMYIRYDSLLLWCAVYRKSAAQNPHTKRPRYMYSSIVLDYYFSMLWGIGVPLCHCSWGMQKYVFGSWGITELKVQVLGRQRLQRNLRRFQKPDSKPRVRALPYIIDIIFNPSQINQLNPNQHEQQVIQNIRQNNMDWINQIKKINNKFKFQLFGKAVENLDKCYSKISQFDPENTGLMGEHTFNLFLNSFGIFLTTQEIRTIKEGFGKEEGKIDYGEFLQNIRHDVSEKRIATIDHVFQELSTNGVIEIKDLFARFDANNHPHCRCMTRPADKIRTDFQNAILRRSADGKHLNQTQFKQYYLDVNSCIPVERQQFFIDNLIHSYRLVDNRVTIDRLKQMEVTIYEKVRQKTYVKKDEGDKSKAGFRFFDMEDKGLVDYGRFVQTLERLGCKFTEKEMKVLYQKHAGSDAVLTYEEMCGLLFEMGSGAKDNTNPVYELAKSNNGWGTTQGMSKKLI